MRILVTGRGTSGSWAIRGEQLGAAIGAHVERNAAKLAGYDAAILVKRPVADLLRRLHIARVPIIYDIVDSWPQPVGNEWERNECMAWLRQQVATIKPRALVCSTNVQANDCAEFGLPILALPHHARPNQVVNPIRDNVERVGYEGAEHYLGYWRGLIDAECKRRGWRFVINPPGNEAALASVDIAVAFRAPRGYAARRWKSAVKLANAQGSGTPCVVDGESSHLETSSGGEIFADDARELSAAFDLLAPVSARRMIGDTLRNHTVRLEAIAAEYLVWLRQLSF
jgi:hypothetical protein